MKILFLVVNRFCPRFRTANFYKAPGVRTRPLPISGPSIHLFFSCVVSRHGYCTNLRMMIKKNPQIHYLEFVPCNFGGKIIKIHSLSVTESAYVIFLNLILLIPSNIT